MILNSSEIKAIEQKEFKLRKNSFSLMQSAGEKCADYISSNVSKNKELLVRRYNQKFTKSTRMVSKKI
jgi:NAD(P)H-hydrate repair Nnr-like enzyme with NAD(P)H-hydrate epimerase domain